MSVIFNPATVGGGGGGMTIGGAVTGGTDLSVLFIHPSGVLAQDPSRFKFPASAGAGGQVLATDGAGVSDWISIVGSGPGAVTHNTVLSTTLNADDNGWTGYNIRQVFNAAALANVPGTAIRITLQASSSGGLQITEAHIGHQALSGDFYDFDPTTMATLTFSGGSAGFTISTGQSITSDDVPFTYDHTRGLVISLRPGSPANFRSRSSLTDAVTCYKVSANEAGVADVTGYGTQSPFFVYNIELKQTVLPDIPVGTPITPTDPGAVLYTDTLGALAQDASKLGWNDSPGLLTVDGDVNLVTKSSRYRIAGTNAVYVVPSPGSGSDNWFEGDAGNTTTTGGSNFGTGPQALFNLTTGTDNTALGWQALQGVTSGASNLGIGSAAGRFIDTGSFNVCLGQNAGTHISSGSNNFCMGNGAGFAIGTGIGNVALGGNALANLANNSGNTAIGGSAGYNLLSGTSNIFIGGGSGLNITGGDLNLLIGGWQGPSSSMSNVVAFSLGGNPSTPSLDLGYTAAGIWSFGPSSQGLHVYNIGGGTSSPTNFERGVFDWNITSNVLTIGTPASSAGGTGALRDTRLYSAGKLAIYRVPNASGDNWFEGNAGNTTTTGFNNFGTGEVSLSHLTTGYQNTAVGSQALRFCDTGNNNVAIGTAALFACTSGTSNFAIGTNAAGNITTASNNFAVGNGALQLGMTVSGNTVVGNGGLQNLTSGDANTALGGGSFLVMTSGSQNCGAGIQAMHNVNTGDNNTALGAYSGYTATSADGSTHVGMYAGGDLTTSTRNLFLGSWRGPSASLTEIIAISTGFYNPGGNGILRLDCGYITSNVWSYQKTTTAQGIHVYNTLDSVNTPTNYERACLDWNLTSNVFRLASQAGGTGTIRIIAIDGFSKAGAPAAGDLPSGTMALIDDTSGNQTWLAFNKGGTIRKVQLV